MLVLIVEDDEDYAEIIAHTLKRDGHETVRVDTIKGAVRFAENKIPDLAVLDVMLPDGTGLELCTALRHTIPELPVLFLSSLDRTADVIAGLNAGADDYLTKPFHPGELVARSRALLRRSSKGLPLTTPVERIGSDGIEIDVTNQVATFNGTDMNCTNIEVDILAQLVRYPGQALSHAFLTEKVWGYKNVSDATLLKGHVSSIRKKLRDAGGNEDVIRTVHGVGYSFTPV
ncbi:MAG: response regulator transcription factor [Dehalococcoidia bacterium]